MNYFDPVMKKTWFIILIIEVVLSILSPTNSPYSEGVFFMVGLIWHAIYTAFIIFLLSKLATKGGLLKSKKTITIWGYIWRTFIVYYISLIPVMLATLMIFGAPPYTSILTSIFMYALHSLASIVAAWCIFSRDRKSQVGWLLSLARGY